MKTEVEILQDRFQFDLLVRLSLIQLTVTSELDEAVTTVKSALPRWWEPIAPDGFPCFYNRVVRTGSTPNARPIRRDTYRATMRMVAGPAFAGYRGEYEDAANMLYGAVLNRFDSGLKLSHPDSGEPLRFVISARIIESDEGLQALQYSEHPPMSYMCIDFPLEVVAEFQNYRKTT